MGGRSGVGLVFATEGSINPIKLGDINLIGKKRDLMGVYKGCDNQILQNMCAILFQGWVKSSDQEYTISKDMKNVIPDDKYSCDYLVKGGYIPPTLIECKRIHPGKHIGDRNTQIQEICDKSEYMINCSLRQLKSTAEFLDYDKYSFHLILDISGYGNGISRPFKDLSIDGLLEDDEIREVINFLADFKPEGLDQITLCWLNVFNFDNKPRVFVYNTTPILFMPKTQPHLEYKGWTIEFYPLGKETEKYRELRISSIARDKSWIKTSWFSTTDNLLTFGPVQKIGDQNIN